MGLSLGHSGGNRAGKARHDTAAAAPVELADHGCVGHAVHVSGRHVSPSSARGRLPARHHPQPSIYRKRAGTRQPLTRTNDGHVVSPSGVDFRADVTERPPAFAVAPHLVEIECSGEEALADSECSICLAEFEPSTQQKPCVLTQQKACGHWHHTACLKQWYGTQLSAGRCRSCPLCKTPVEPPAAAATAPVTATPAAARAIELYNSYPRVVM